MEVFKNRVTKNMIPDILNSAEFQKYGSVAVNYDFNETKIKMDEAIKAFNIIAGESLFMQSPYRLDDSAQFMISYTSRTPSEAKVSFEDFDYFDALEDVKRSGEPAEIKCSIKIQNIVARNAVKMGLVAEKTANGVNVRVKGPGSLYRKIAESLSKKETQFIAPKKLLTINTARVYCSMLRRDFYNKSTAVSAGPNTCIYFGYETKRIVFQNKLTDLIFEESHRDDEKIASVLQDIEAIVSKMFPDDVLVHLHPEEIASSVYENDPDWKTGGYESEEAYELAWSDVKPGHVAEDVAPFAFNKQTGEFTIPVPDEDDDF